MSNTLFIGPLHLSAMDKTITRTQATWFTDRLRSGWMLRGGGIVTEDQANELNWYKSIARTVEPAALFLSREDVSAPVRDFVERLDALTSSTSCEEYCLDSILLIATLDLSKMQLKAIYRTQYQDYCTVITAYLDRTEIESDPTESAKWVSEMFRKGVADALAERSHIN